MRISKIQKNVGIKHIHIPIRARVSGHELIAGYSPAGFSGSRIHGTLNCGPGPEATKQPQTTLPPPCLTVA